MDTQTQIARLEETPAPHTDKKYKCDRCGHVSTQRTNHYGKTWSIGRVNTCPDCPPWAKYPEYSGRTTWTCIESPNQEETKENEEKENS